MLLKQPKRNRRVEISDLLKDPVVAWQARYYIPLAVGMGWLLPMAVAGLH